MADAELEADGDVVAMTAARRVLADCAGETAHAVTAFIARLAEDDALRAKVLLWAAHNLMRQAKNEANRSIVTPRGAAGRAQEASSSTGLKARAKRNFYEYTLFNGAMLGNATIADVVAQAELHELHAASNTVKAKWMRLIEARLRKGNGRLVAETLTEDDLERLHEEARNG